MSEYIFLPTKEVGSTRVGLVRKAVADLVGEELAYYTKLTALGPRPDKDIDGFIEYDSWQREAMALARTYLAQL